MKYSPNGRSLDRSIKMVGRGAAYIFENDEFGFRKDDKMTSLGYSNSLALNFNKETDNSEHTNFDVTTIDETRVTSIAPTVAANFSEFKDQVMEIYLGSKTVEVPAQTLDVDLTLDKTYVNEKNGFIYPVKGGIDTVTLTFTNGSGTSNPVVNGKHITIQNGSIGFLSLEQQRAAGATTLLDPTSANTVVEGTIKTLPSTRIEFEPLTNKYYGLYFEITSSFKGKTYLTQFYIHSVNVVVDTLPIKQEDETALNYDVTFNMLASNAITGSGESKYFSKITTDITDV